MRCISFCIFYIYHFSYLSIATQQRFLFTWTSFQINKLWRKFKLKNCHFFVIFDIFWKFIQFFFREMSQSGYTGEWVLFEFKKKNIFPFFVQFFYKQTNKKEMKNTMKTKKKIKWLNQTNRFIKFKVHSSTNLSLKFKKSKMYAMYCKRKQMMGQRNQINKINRMK